MMQQRAGDIKHSISGYDPGQGCARLIFSGWLDSDSYDNPGDSTPTQLKSQIRYPDSTPTQLKSQIY